MITVRRVRRAYQKDLAGLNRLLPQLTSSNRPPLTARAWGSILSNKDMLAFAARDGGELVGLTLLFIMRKPSGSRAWIEDVVVDSEYRGRGLGTRLCVEAIAAARRLKIKDVNLTSRPGRGAANALYRKLGFQKRDTNVYRLELQ